MRWCRVTLGLCTGTVLEGGSAVCCDKVGAGGEVALVGGGFGTRWEQGKRCTRGVQCWPGPGAQHRASLPLGSASGRSSGYPK